jgi:hypothetical protein
MKRMPITLKFCLGCIVIVVTSIFQVVFPWFLGWGPYVILFFVVFCSWQWHQKTREMRNQLAEEQTVRLAAEHYINSRLQPNPRRRRGWF